MEVAIVKCKGLDTANTTVARGNQEADLAAKKAGGYLPRQQLVSVKEKVRQGTQMTIETIKGRPKG